MVIQIRVDDRLIHGQVALVWSKELNTPGIVWQMTMLSQVMFYE